MRLPSSALHCCLGLPALRAELALLFEADTAASRCTQGDFPVRHRRLRAKVRSSGPPSSPPEAPFVFVYPEESPAKLQCPERSVASGICERPERRLTVSRCRAPADLHQRPTRRRHPSYPRLYHPPTSVAARAEDVSSSSPWTPVSPAANAQLDRPGARHGGLQYHPAQAGLLSPRSFSYVRAAISGVVPQR